jgi:uncharacterized short protein YbdD (DUF466 family)
MRLTLRIAQFVNSCSLRSRFRRAARKFWRAFREWCGDAAYDRYLSSPVIRRSASCPLTAEDFYLDQLNRRYSRPHRCC